jgi:hypothetical protein
VRRSLPARVPERLDLHPDLRRRLHLHLLERVVVRRGRRCQEPRALCIGVELPRARRGGQSSRVSGDRQLRSALQRRLHRGVRPLPGGLRPPRRLSGELPRRHCLHQWRHRVRC